MTSDPDHMRSLIVSAASDAALLEGLKIIPGYQYVELEDDLRRRIGLPVGEDRFYLEAESGERITVRHRRGQSSADTVNIQRQDAESRPVPIHLDEIVRLHEAIKGTEGLHSQVIAAESDLRPPSG